MLNITNLATLSSADLETVSGGDAGRRDFHVAWPPRPAPTPTPTPAPSKGSGLCATIPTLRPVLGDLICGVLGGLDKDSSKEVISGSR